MNIAINTEEAIVRILRAWEQGEPEVAIEKCIAIKTDGETYTPQEMEDLLRGAITMIMWLVNRRYPDVGIAADFSEGKRLLLLNAF